MRMREFLGSNLIFLLPGKLVLTAF